MGTWEWLAAGLVKAGFSVTALAKTQPDSQYTKLLDEYRAQVGVEIFARGAASELLAASRALKKVVFRLFSRPRCRSRWSVY